MGYIEKNLMDGEQIVYEARQHWMIYWKPFLLLLIGIGLFAIPTSDMALVMQICMSLVLLVVAGIWAVNIYGGRKYILTNRRLILKRGLVRRESTDLVLRRCEGVSISQTILGRASWVACWAMAPCRSPRARWPMSSNSSSTPWSLPPISTSRLLMP